MTIGTDLSLLRRLLAHAGAKESDLFCHRGKKLTAGLIGWFSPLAADEMIFVGARFRDLSRVPQKSFDNRVGSIDRV
jgi:hypothetical protein